MPILLLFVGRDGEAGSAFGLNDGLQPWQQGPPEVGEFHWSEDELRAAIRTQLEVEVSMALDTSAICNRLLVCVRWASANRKATATDSGSFDCINSSHDRSICSRSARAIRATISTYGIWAEGISSGRAHSHHFGEGCKQTPPHGEQVPRYPTPAGKTGRRELAGECGSIPEQ